MLAERTGNEPTPRKEGLQIQVSKLLLASMVAAIATSVAMIVVAIMVAQSPPGPGPGPDGGPPPPVPVTSLVLITVITGMFVVSWLAVVAALARDQVLRHLRDLPASSADHTELIARLRADLAEDRRTDLAALEARIAALTAEYGEQRETDGYVNGMRAAVTRPGSGGADVRTLHRVPPA